MNFILLDGNFFRVACTTFTFTLTSFFVEKMGLFPELGSGMHAAALAVVWFAPRELRGKPSTTSEKIVTPTEGGS